ncbi:hypothetical protein AB4305_00640 [Nocardia sp. 2YAB30]
MVIHPAWQIRSTLEPSHHAVYFGVEEAGVGLGLLLIPPLNSIGVGKL